MTTNKVNTITDLTNRLEAKEYVMKLFLRKSSHSTFITVYLNSGIAYYDELQSIVDELKGYTHDRIMVSVTSDRCGDSYLTMDINNLKKSD